MYRYFKFSTENFLEEILFRFLGGSILSNVCQVACVCVCVSVSVCLSVASLSKSYRQQWRIQDFPDGGAPTPRWGHQPTILPNFYRKLHENERIWTPRGGAHPWCPPLDPPMVKDTHYQAHLKVRFRFRVKVTHYYFSTEKFWKKSCFGFWGSIMSVCLSVCNF